MLFKNHLKFKKSIDYMSPTFYEIFFGGNQSENIPVDA